MQQPEIIKYIEANLENNVPSITITASVRCLDDLEVEENTYFSIIALFKRNLKQQLVLNTKTVELSGAPADFLRILEKPANQRFFENVKFEELVEVEASI